MVIEGVELIEEGDMVCLSYKKNGYFETESIKKWKEYLKEGMTALDVGSYSGLYAILAAKVCRSIAIEPNKVMASRIAENALNNGVNLEVILAAAGSEPGTCSIRKSFPTSSAAHVAPGSEIPIITLDYSNVCALKVDVEGMEIEVLKGMRELPPLVIAESLNEESERQLIDYMEGYEVTRDERNLIFLDKRRA